MADFPDDYDDGWLDHADAVEEASTLGLKPGEWPTSLAYDGRTMFRLGSHSDIEGQLRFVVYGADGALLAVLND